MVMQLSDFYNSLEGKNQYPALLKRKNQDSNSVGSKNLYPCSAASFFFLRNFSRMLFPYLKMTMNTSMLTTWSLGQDSSANTKTAVHFSLACFSTCFPCQLIDFSLLSVGLTTLIYPSGLVQPDKQVMPWAREREWWHLCCVSASLGHPLQLPCMGFLSTTVSLLRDFSIWFGN